MNREPNEAPAWLADAMMDMRSDFYTGKLDGAVINKGGIRHPIPEGAISEGFLKSLLPFYNNFEVIKVSGKDLKEALKVMAFRGGDGLSRGFHVEYDADFNIIKATLNGKPIKEKKNYYILTIYYLATGGDFLESFKNGKVIYRDDKNYLDRVRDYLLKLNRKKMKLEHDKSSRMFLVN
jgi:2',3'-cyclic-nucleotide 2'-phosphodiesterase (5'-nucleotidase family)